MPHGSIGRPIAMLRRAAKHYRLLKDEHEWFPRSMSGYDLGF